MLNRFNRVVTFLLTLFLLITVPAFLIFPQVVSMILEEFSVWTAAVVFQQPGMTIGEAMASVSALLRLLLAVLFVLLFLLILYQQLRRTKTDKLIVQTRGSAAHVSLESVKHQLSYHVDGLEDVIEVVTRVQPANGRVRVTMDVLAEPDVSIPEKEKEIRAMVRDVVEKRMGLKVDGAPIIQFQLATLPTDAYLPGPEGAESGEGEMTLQPLPSTAAAEMPVEPEEVAGEPIEAEAVSDDLLPNAPSDTSSEKMPEPALEPEPVEEESAVWTEPVGEDAAPEGVPDEPSAIEPKAPQEDTGDFYASDEGDDSSAPGDFA